MPKWTFEEINQQKDGLKRSEDKKAERLWVLSGLIKKNIKVKFIVMVERPTPKRVVITYGGMLREIKVLPNDFNRGYGSHILMEFIPGRCHNFMIEVDHIVEIETIDE